MADIESNASKVAETENLPVETSENQDLNALVADDKKSESQNEPKSDKTPRSSVELDGKIVKQVEYYFGNYNLPRDKFLTEQTELDDGWVPIKTMFKFKRLAELAPDYGILLNALKNTSLIEVDKENERIRRSPANPQPLGGDLKDLKEESIKRTVYIKNFPKDGGLTLDSLLEHFKSYGPLEAIHMRNYKECTLDGKWSKTGFKGSILIVFPSVEKAKEFLEGDAISFQNKLLLRKWYAVYLAEKETEPTTKHNIRQQQNAEKMEEGELPPTASQNLHGIGVDPIPRGAFIFASGFKNTTSREKIKKAMAPYTTDIGFLDFSKGNTEGFIRLCTAHTNQETVERIGDNLQVEGAEIRVRVVEGDEEEEQIKKAEDSKLKFHLLSNREKKKRHDGRTWKRKWYKKRKSEKREEREG